MNANISAKALPIQNKAFTFTSNLTVREYVNATPHQRTLMRVRLAEVRISPKEQDFFLNYPDIINFLLVVSDDAPEAAIILPIIQRIVATSPRFTLRIIRDTDDLSKVEEAVDDLDLSEESETDLPLLLLFDEEWNWREQWGPRPEAAETYFDQWLETHPEFEQLASGESDEEQQAYSQLTNELLQEMRVWYNSGLDRECIREIYALLKSLQDDDSEDEPS